MRTRLPILSVVAILVACLGAQAQTPTITGVANNATNFITGTSIAPGELLNIFGTNLGDTPAVNCGSATGFSTTCGTVSVTVSGQAAGVRMESATNVVIEAPVDAPLGAGSLVLTHTVAGQAQVSKAFAITIVPTAPEPYLTNVNNVLFANCFNASNVAISSANPAAPESTVRCLATGFGATNPVVPTGTIPPSTLPPVVAPVTVTVGGQTAMVTSATLQGPTVGQDQVIFKVPPVFAGNEPLLITVGGVDSQVQPFLPIGVAGPNVSSVSNAASNALPGLPNAGVAPGAIFIAKGSGLGPNNITFAPAAFQSTTVSGTSVAVTVNGTTVNALMYYTSAGQIAALLPSNTPTGAGFFTVTYNGQTSNEAPIMVVANNLGIFTLDSTGQGPGIVTYPDYSLVSAVKSTPCGGPNTSCGAANPGDTLILWATGLGAINGSDASGAGLGVNMTNIPLTLLLGGVQAPVVYQGRSGCCIGEDQIVFTVPANVPTGCAVPLVVQIGNEISNYTSMPVANGSRSCTPTNATFASVEQAISAGSFTVGSMDLYHIVNGSGGAPEDDAKVQFFKTSAIAGTEPFFVSYIDYAPLGTCTVYNNANGDQNVPFGSLANLDAGSTITLKGSNGSLSVPTNQSRNAIGTAGMFLVPGSFTASGTGGADIGPFSAAFTIPTPATLVSPVNNATVNRSDGMTVTWTGGSGNVSIKINGCSDSGCNNGAVAICRAPASAGKLVMPPSVLLALPTNVAGFVFSMTNDTTFTATGLSLGVISLDRYDVAGFGFGWGSGNFTLK